jgi:hypothetical protein
MLPQKPTIVNNLRPAGLPPNIGVVQPCQCKGDPCGIRDKVGKTARFNDHLRLLDSDNILIIVAPSSKATKAKMLQMLHDSRSTPCNMLQFRPFAKARE